MNRARFTLLAGVVLLLFWLTTAARANGAGIDQASVPAAVPAQWLDATAERIRVHPQWVLTGDQADSDLQQLLAQAEPDWRPAAEQVLVNHHHQPVWFYLKLGWNQPLQADRWLQIDWPYLSTVEMHVRDLDSGEWLSLGSSRPDHHGRWFINALPHGLPLAYEDTLNIEVFLKVESPSKLLVPMEVWDADALMSRDNQRTIWLGVFFGVLFAMALYNLSLFVFVRDSSYGYYVLYVLAMTFYTLGATGLGQVFVWGNNPWLQQHVFGVSSCLAFLCAAMFIRRFLDLGHYGGWLNWCSAVIVGFWALLTLANLTGTMALWLVLEDIGAIISCFVAVATGVAVWRRGNVSGKYVTLAWLALITATFLLMLGLSGLIAPQSWHQPFQNIGIVIETLLLSLALAERINREREQRQQAQELSLVYYKKADEAQRHALEVERHAKSQLEDQVERRTRELRSALVKLEATNAELDSRSKMDGLTGLSNRRWFDTVLMRTLIHAETSGQPMCLVMGDLDHFKLLNDSYGHPAGDACLMTVASIWRDVLGMAGATVARYGGEEFIAILPDTSQHIAVNLAERLRQAIEHRTCYFDNYRIRATMSFGVVQTTSSSDCPKKLVQQVDAALYEAKRQGRNQVVVYSSALQLKAPPE